MAYVVMAIAALMCIVGLYFVVSGSQIVQVEAGWTSVIAGSVLVAGGVITFALSVVTRILLKVQTTLEAGSTLPVVSASDAQTPPLRTDAPDKAPRQPAAPKEASADLDSMADAPSVPITGLQYQMPPPLPYAVAVQSALAEEVAEVTAEAAEPSSPAPMTSEEPEAEALAPPPAEAPHPADDYKLDTPSTPEFDLPPVEPEPIAARSEHRRAEPAAADDWLDEALAAIDKEIPLQAPAHKPEPVMPEPAPDPMPPGEEVATKRDESSPAAATPVLPEQMSAPAEAPISAPPKAEPLPAPSTPAGTAAVIGRYEADGTSYIMYSDGSIEAQSEAGVYRFGSMAELKAHIES